MRASLLLVPLAALAAACSPASTPTVTSLATTSLLPTGGSFPTTTDGSGGSTSAAGSAADPSVLATIVLFPEDLPAAYCALPLDPADSGFRPAGASLSSALDPDDEADDIVRFGLLGDFTTSYGSTDGLWVALEAVAFADPEGAAGYLADWQADLARGAADTTDGSDLVSFTASPDGTAGDEAVRARYTLAADTPDSPGPTGVVRVVRSGSTLAWTWAVGEDPGAAVDALGPLVEHRLLAVLAGEVPPRDPAGLGLASPPTTRLTSFAFEYSYGIEAADHGGGFILRVAGDFQGPDRTSCRVTHTASGQETLVGELVAIGTRVWLGTRTGYQEVPLRHPSALADLRLCPGHPLFWEDTGFHRLPEAPGTLDRLDGLAVLRSDLAGDQSALAALGYPPARAARVGRYEVARAVDGGWTVAIDAAEDTDLAAARRAFGLSADPSWAGIPATIFTRLRLSRPDDPSIEVEPPLMAS